MKRWIPFLLAAVLIWWLQSPVPVPPERGRYDVHGATPEETALAFVPSSSEGGRAWVLRRDEGGARVRVDLSSRGDDSAAGATYWVTLKRDGNGWRVIAATYDVDCARGFWLRGWTSCV